MSFTDFPLVKLKTLTNFPSNAFGRNGIDVTLSGGNFYMDIDYSDYVPVSAIPPGAPNLYALMYDNIQNIYTLAPISLLGGGGAGGIVDAPNDGFFYGRQSTAWAKVLALAGGTLTGTLVLAHDPANPLEAATKAYVDQAVASGFVPTQQIVVNPGNVTVVNSDSLIVLNKAVGQPTNVLLPPAAGKIGRIKISDWKGDADTNNITVIPAAGEMISGLSQWVIAGSHASITLDPIRGSINGYVL
jgi:hypothetical protein